MHKILHLIPDFQYRGTTRLVQLVATGLPRERFQSRVCGIGRAGPTTRLFSQAGITPAALDWNRWLDGNPVRRLLELLREFRPDTLHTWGETSLRFATCAARALVPSARPRLVASGLATSRRGRFLRAWINRQLFQRVSTFVTRSAAESERYCRLGIPSRRIVMAGIGTEENEEPLEPATLSLPPRARVIVGVGPLEPHKGFLDAIWALDVLRYVYPELHLVAAGSGSDIPALRRFASGIRVEKFVHFPGPREEIRSLLARAEVVWVPTRTRGGVQAALEAMAAKRPVVAAALPELAAVVQQGVTGFLVPPQDPVALARQTRVLLDSESLQREQGAAGKERIRHSFTAAHLVGRFHDLYTGL